MLFMIFVEAKPAVQVVRTNIDCHSLSSSVIRPSTSALQLIRELCSRFERRPETQGQICALYCCPNRILFC